MSSWTYSENVHERATIETDGAEMVITRTFPPDRRGAAMGLWGATAGVAKLNNNLHRSSPAVKSAARKQRQDFTRAKAVPAGRQIRGTMVRLPYLAAVALAASSPAAAIGPA